MKRVRRISTLTAVMTLSVGLAIMSGSGAAFAQEPAPLQPQVTAPASRTAPWLQTLPGRRGLEPRPKPADKGLPTDINSATVKALIGLRGIGRTRANDIIQGRPYNAKDDLVKRNILSPEVYDVIKDAIVARQK